MLGLMSISLEISIIIPVIDEEENIKPTFNSFKNIFLLKQVMK